MKPDIYTITLTNPESAQNVVHFSDNAIDVSKLEDGVSMLSENCMLQIALLPGGSCEIKLDVTESVANLDEMSASVNYSLDAEFDMIKLPVKLSIQPTYIGRKT